MGPNRRLPLLLGLLVLALVALVGSRGGLGSLSTFWSPTDAPATLGASPEGAAVADGPLAPRQPAFPDVNLEGLEAERAEPSGGGRNPFSLRAAPRPTPADVPRVPSSEPAALSPNRGGAPVPSTRASAPSIPLKVIGIVDLPGDQGKLAVLSDGDFVYHGRQGDVVEGRHRIVIIGDESVDLEYSDGRGRVTLALTGS